MKHLKLSFLLVFFAHFGMGQSGNIKVEAYVFEEKNRGFLNQVEISISEVNTAQVVFEGETNTEGFFDCNLPKNQKFIISAKKNAFHTLIKDFSTKSEGSEKLFLSLEMKREPGYIFEATLAPTRESEQPVDAITGAKIEIYNNTTGKQEVLIPESSSYTFSHPLIPGNHYTMLIRKKGYYNKRIEAYVDIEGCILCFEGTGEVRPGVTDNLTDGLTKGSLVSNIEMRPIELGKGIEIPDIYYDYDKANLRPRSKSILDDLIVLLKNNPALIVEMGSHTDSRGKDEYNRKLSERRAKAVVDYLLETGKINKRRLSPFGYGESELKNRCGNGVDCSEKEHQENRRTEMKVVGILDYDPYMALTLEQIIRQEQSEILLDEMIEGKSEQIQAVNFDELPEEVKRDILRSQGKDPEINNESEQEASPEKEEPSERQQMPRDHQDAEKVIEEVQSANTQRITSFNSDFSGYSVYLGKLPGPDHVVQKSLTDKHGKIYRKGENRYYLGTFETKKLAKKYQKTLVHMYPNAEVELIK